VVASTISVASSGAVASINIAAALFKLNEGKHKTKKKKKKEEEKATGGRD
jgi:hypothetical protein